MLDIVHDAVPDNTIVLTGAGHSQAQFLQEYTVNDASQVISPNGFSTMGFTVPGAIGAKLAAPDRPVLGFAGDGDFLMTVQELAMAVQYDIDVTYVVVDNAGWQSIRDLQLDAYGADHGFAAEFRTPDGTPIAPDLVMVARGFGVDALEATDKSALKAAVGRALTSGGPTVIVVPVRREFPESAGPTSGWWDVPVPASMPERRRTYEREVAPVRRDAVKTQLTRYGRCFENVVEGQEDTAMTKFDLTWRRGLRDGRERRAGGRGGTDPSLAQDDEVSVMTYFSKDLGEGTLKELLAGFEGESGTTVSFADVGHEDFKTGILIQLAGGNPPDVHSWAGARTAFQVDSGVAASLDEMWAANDLDSSFSQALIDSAATYNGSQVPGAVRLPLRRMFYNPKVIADAGHRAAHHVGRAQGQL